MKLSKLSLSAITVAILVATGLTANIQVATAEALPNQTTAVVGETYYRDISFDCNLQQGETGPITYSIDGNLPSGITLDAVTGIVSGTFSAAGTWDLTGTTWCNYTGSNGNAAGSGYPTDAHFTVISEAATFTPPPTLEVNAIGGPNCDLEIIGTFPESQDAGTAQLLIQSDDGSISLTLAPQTSDTPFVLNYSINDPRPLDSPLVVAANPSGDISCTTFVDVTLSYQYNRAPAGSVSVNDTYAVFQLENTPFISQVSYGDGLCGLYLTGRFPASGDPGTRPTVTVISNNREVSVLPRISWDGTFYVALPLDDLTQFDYQNGALVLTGPTPQCGEMTFVSAKIWISGNEQAANTVVFPNRICDAGSFDNGERCALAPAGSFVAGNGMDHSTLCPKGTFQAATGAVECIDAPIGSYVNRKGAIAATQCQQGMVTEEAGSTNISECYALKNQTFTTLKVASKLKFGAAVTVPAVSDNLLPLTVTTSGPCIQAETTLTIKIAKVSRTVRAVRITAGSVAGNCNVSFANNGDAFYRSYSKNLAIKVSRTGK